MSEPAVRSLSGGSGIGESVDGPALVSGQGFGVQYELDIATGVISNREHGLFGERITGKTLVFTRLKDGVAASWALASLKRCGIAPLAIVFRHSSPIFTQATLFAGLPLLHRLEQDPCTLVRSGDRVTIFPEGGLDILGGR